MPFTAASEHDVLKTLRAAGARSDASAVPLPDMNEREVAALDRLIETGIVIRVGEDRYCVDETQFEPRRRLGRAVRMVLGALLAVYVAIVIAGMWRTR